MVPNLKEQVIFSFKINCFGQGFWPMKSSKFYSLQKSVTLPETRHDCRFHPKCCYCWVPSSISDGDPFGSCLLPCPRLSYSTCFFSTHAHAYHASCETGDLTLTIHRLLQEWKFHCSRSITL